MASVEKYRINFSDPDANKFMVKIYEESFAGSLTLLTPGVGVVNCKLVDNDENVYLPIQPSELDIRFISEENFSLSELFEDGALTDTQFKIEWYSIQPITLTTRLLWVGFLDTESCNEPIIDDPKEVNLIAKDAINTMKKYGFTNHDDEFQYGKETLLQCIEWCLAKTTFEFDLHVWVSIFEESMTDRSIDPAAEPFSQCKIHTRSLKEKNCYEVIEAICRAFGATLYQANGVWVIDRKHDRWNNRIHAATVLTYPYVSATPAAINYTFSNTTFTPLFGHNRFFIAPFKKCQTTYLFEVPKDIPRNANFQEGEFIALISDADNSAYTIDHWQLCKNLPTEINSTAVPYRNDNFDPVSHQLIESTIRLPRESSGTPNPNRLRATSVECNQGDRVNISAETKARFYYDTGDSYFGVFYVRFVGLSSTVYTLQDQGNDTSAPNDECTWETGTGSVVQFRWPPNADADIWHSFSCRSEPFPEDGDLYIYLYAWDSVVTSNETWFKNVKVSFDLFMGATTNLIGQRAVITETSSFRDKGEIDIIIGDSPKKIISGALFRTTDETHLTTTWRLNDGPQIGPLLQITNRAHYQFRYRFKTKVEGQIKGMTYAHPGGGLTVIQPNVEMAYATSKMIGKVYIPSNATLSPASAQASVFLQEFYNEDEAADPIGSEEIVKYLYSDSRG